MADQHRKGHSVPVTVNVTATILKQHIKLKNDK